jgi:hypothetical protein
MSDRVVGVAVLDRTVEPEVLHVLCFADRPGGGFVFPHSIPVHEEGKPPASGCEWTYRVQGKGMLRVRPSVRVQGKTRCGRDAAFHNAADWVVRFVDRDLLVVEPSLQLRLANGALEAQHVCG